jgi:ribosomal protein S14
VTVSDGAETPLWVVGSGAPRPRPLPRSCALCASPPASAFGLCRPHLAAAAAELTRLTPSAQPVGSASDRPEATRFSELCRRCGRPGHDARRCDA